MALSACVCLSVRQSKVGVYPVIETAWDRADIWLRGFCGTLSQLDLEMVCTTNPWFQTVSMASAFVCKQREYCCIILLYSIQKPDLQ